MDLDAKDFLIKMARENINEVTIVALGPLTNIALVHSALSLFMLRYCQHLDNVDLAS